MIVDFEVHLFNGYTSLLMRIKKLSYIFTYSRSSLFSLLLMTGMCICVSGIWQKASAQDCPPEQAGEVGKPITVCSLLYALKREVLPPDQRNKTLVNVVRTRGINFVQTEDEIKLFRDAGANETLIAAISKESEKLKETPFGNIYLGKKYLDSGKKFRLLEEDLTSQAKQLRMQKNEEEALKKEEEAKKNDEEAIKNLDQAIPFFKKALEIEPNNVPALNNLGVVYENLKKYDEAISYYDQVVAIEPAISRYMNRAGVYEKKGLATVNKDERRAAFDKANEDYSQAIRLDPCYTGAYQRRADNYKFFNLMDKYNADMQEIAQIKSGQKDCAK